MLKVRSRSSAHKGSIENVEFDAERLADVVQEMDSCDAADVINHLPSHEIVELLSRIDSDAEVRKLIRDPQNTDISAD